MYGSRLIIDCDRCFRWVGLLYVGFGTHVSCNASGLRYVLDMCNCILGPRPRTHIVIHSHTPVSLELPDCWHWDT
jgi:hypothetical protein